MKISLRSFVFTLTILSTTASFAALQEGSYKGKSSLIKSDSIKDNDVMALILKKDPNNANNFYAVLAEYDRVPFTNITVKSALTRWVNRAYAYHVEKISDLQYAMRPLRSTNEGQIVVEANTNADLLVLKNPDSMDGATVVRNNRFTEIAEETIQMNGRVGSTWENYVSGQFFASHDNTGGDYTKKTVNTELYEDGTAFFYQPDIKGLFSIQEAAPLMFTFSEVTPNNTGREKLLGKIGVFIDIVNWKHLGIDRFTTEELLIINPNDAKDVGFYYERH